MWCTRHTGGPLSGLERSPAVEAPSLILPTGHSAPHIYAKTYLNLGLAPSPHTLAFPQPVSCVPRHLGNAPKSPQVDSFTLHAIPEGTRDRNGPDHPSSTVQITETRGPVSLTPTPPGSSGLQDMVSSLHAQQGRLTGTHRGQPPSEGQPPNNMMCRHYPPQSPSHITCLQSHCSDEGTGSERRAGRWGRNQLPSPRVSASLRHLVLSPLGRCPHPKRDGAGGKMTSPFEEIPVGAFLVNGQHF